MATEIDRVGYSVGCLYRPLKVNFQEFLVALEECFGEFWAVLVICGGDLNIDSCNNTFFFHAIKASIVKQVIKSPTRNTQTSNTLLDIILIYV